MPGPTIIDALIIELGIDPSGIAKGRKQAGAELLQTKKDAESTAKAMEERGKQAARFYSQVRNEVLALFAVFTAGRGFKEFISDTVRSNANLARLSYITKQSVSDFASWGRASETVGGSLDSTTQSMSNLVREFQMFAVTGESSVIPWFRSLGVNISDVNTGKMRDIGDILLDLSDKFQTMDPARAATFGQAIGLDPGTVNLLLKGRDAVKAMLAEQEKNAATTQRNAEAALHLQATWTKLLQTANSIGEELLTRLAPVLERIIGLLEGLAEWAQDNAPLVEAAFVALTTVALALSAAMGVSAVRGVLALLGTVAPLLGGLSEMALGMAVLTETALPALSAAFLAVGAAIEATPVGWILTAIAAIGVAGYYLYKHWNDIAAWWSGLWNGMGDDVDNAYRKKWSENLPGRKRAGPALVTTSSTPVNLRARGANYAESDVNTLMKLGWTRDQAIGIAANIQRESGGQGHTAVGDNGQAYGIAQWHRDRQANFRQWAGHDIRSSTRDEQLRFINYELRYGNEKAAGAALASSRNAADAASIISSLYERPADRQGEMLRRSQIAQTLSAKIPAGIGVAARPQNVAGKGDVHIDKIVVNTAATDANGIAKSLDGALKRNLNATHANYGAS
ncbi:MAG: hypothetical protein GC190_19345 [Alphaproteobacteria bacterium]|nr:hypothetical protein [Alphaproteobacteria bacterium]